MIQPSMEIALWPEHRTGRRYPNVTYNSTQHFVKRREGSGSRSSFHAWLKRAPLKHSQEDERLKVATCAAHEKPGGLMVPKDCTKNCRTKALSLGATGWLAYDERWAFNASNVATSKSLRNRTMIPRWPLIRWSSNLLPKTPMPSGMWILRISPQRKAGSISLVSKTNALVKSWATPWARE